MKRFLIAFRLSNPTGPDIYALPTAIKNHIDSNAVDFSPSTWLVHVGMTAEKIVAKLRRHMAEGDRVAVIELPSGADADSHGLSDQERQLLNM